MTFGFPPKAETTLALNGLSPERYLAIASETIRQLGWTVQRSDKTSLTAHTHVSWTSWGEDFIVAISGEEATLTSRCVGSQIIDFGKNNKNIDTFTSKFNELLQGGYADNIEESTPAEANGPGSETTDPEQFTDTSNTTEQKFKNFFSLFVPKQNYFITPIIIDLNIAIFLLMVLSGVSFMDPTTEDLLKWGANLRSVTLSGQWWRLITNTFLHIGFLHLLVNMYALAFIGVLLEHYLGKLRFAVAYLCTGVLASLQVFTSMPLR